MIKTNVDDTPIATSATNHIHSAIPLPTIPTPTSTINNTQMNANTTNENNDEFMNWIQSTPESEFASPDFGHTPIQSFEDDGVEDTPYSALVTPALDDFNDFFTEGDGKGASSLDHLEGLFTMDGSPDALMTYWDNNAFSEVSGTGFDSSINFMNTETEAIPLMGPPTNVSFPIVDDELPSKKKRKVLPNSATSQNKETMNPANMHVSPPSQSQFIDKERDARVMPPPSDLPVHLSSSHSSSSTSPKPRSPTEQQSFKKLSGKKYNGTRAGITPEKLIPMDAPIQQRKYVLPSSTSRKELPAAFVDKVNQHQLAAANGRGKKRSRVELESPSELPEDSFPNSNSENTQAELGGVNLPADEAAALQNAIHQKRLQNTYAARRSRQRKLEYQRNLEERNKELEEENEGLRRRVGELENMLFTGGGGGGGTG